MFLPKQTPIKLATTNDHFFFTGALVSTPSYFLLPSSFSHGANTFLLLANVSFNSGKCLPKTSFMPEYCTHLSPTLVYMSSFHCPAINRSDFSLLDAMTINTLNAVSENPNPGITGSE